MSKNTILCEYSDEIDTYFPKVIRKIILEYIPESKIALNLEFSKSFRWREWSPTYSTLLILHAPPVSKGLLPSSYNWRKPSRVNCGGRAPIWYRGVGIPLRVGTLPFRYYYTL